ncbi:MAG: hypothetical protein DIZ80_10470 [endosymbiont of Galathealinum brachiosum]|uniref:Uncharacterized protein n=1 Tax=endosymbiont of Galathealinum brachiosum TaxID=2200906 RepID=A0A370DCS7_9GAMM|nr:MAG: hypothetical protein DIZ80_10470 [endosymbiont of Galathealinum brachiosum]
MKYIIKYLVLMLLINTNVFAVEKYNPDSGDKELDESLVLIHKNINRNKKSKLSHFVDRIAEEFQIPVGKVEELFNHYKFKVPDVLMSVSIADVSGEPLQNVAGLYFKNKEKGWKYALKQLNIRKGSKIYNQIKKDITSIQ